MKLYKVLSAIALTLLCGCFYDLWNMADVDMLFNIVVMNFLSCSLASSHLHVYMYVCVFCLGWIMWRSKLHYVRKLPRRNLHHCAINVELIFWQCVRSNHSHILLVHGTAAVRWSLCCLHYMFSHDVNMWITCGWWLHVHKIRRILPVVIVVFYKY